MEHTCKKQTGRLCVQMLATEINVIDDANKVKVMDLTKVEVKVMDLMEIEGKVVDLIVTDFEDVEHRFKNGSELNVYQHLGQGNGHDRN